MDAALLATKLHIPPRAAGLVARPHLLEQLQRGLADQHKLMLISAPAGFGKSTLVTEWIATLQSHHSPFHSTWIALEEADNDLVRFLRYFFAAFQQVDMMLATQAQAMLEMHTLPVLSSLLDALLNDLVALEMPLILVLDDYHVITNTDIHTVLDYVLDHQPAAIHLVLTTRADPPLPLARFRARRQMTELRAHDLRFTAEETRTFLGSTTLSLAENAMHMLHERTEGWAVGLQLAALALRQQPDPAAFIETFRGSHRYVLDYLAEEVVNRQDEELRSFLMQISMLNRFNAALCNALTGRNDAQQLITRLEQFNLFMIPLDDERHWYRFHHLFADYLQSLLLPSERAALCQKAAGWHADNGLTTEAVRYALACGDHVFAAMIIEQALDNDSTWSDGNLTQLAAWLAALPSDILQSRPRLSLHASRVLYLQLRFDEAETYLDHAEGLLHAQPLLPDHDMLLALITLYRGAIAAVRGDAQQALALIPAAQARLPHNHQLVQARAFFSLGLAYATAGHTTQAIEHYMKASVEAHTAGVLFLEMHALCAAAQLQISQGCLKLATRTCQTVLQLTNGVRLPPMGLAWILLGTIALERNNLGAAEQYFQDGVVLARQGGLRDDLALGLVGLGRVHAYQGRVTAMYVAIDEALSIIRASGMPQAERAIHAQLAFLQHLLGARKAAAHWATMYQSRRTEPLHETEELTLAHILLGTDNQETVPVILRPLLESSVTTGRMQTALEAMLLFGCYHQAQGEYRTALTWLEQALELAAPEGAVRVFLDMGQPLCDTLPRLRSTAPELVDLILYAHSAPAEPPSSTFAWLPEPLSEQELRVLKLIIAGKSNAEIAAALIISVGTAKWHVHNILQKLGVKNRPQAIALVRKFEQ